MSIRRHAIHHVPSRAISVLACLVWACVAAGQYKGDDYFNQAAALQRACKQREAIPLYTKAIELDASDAEAFSNRARAWLETDEFDKAVDDCTEAIRLKPGDIEAYVTRAEARSEKGEYDTAIADCNQAAALRPNDSSAYYFRGVAWDRKGNHDRAIKDFTEAIRLDPKDAEYYHGRANAWKHRAAYAKAIEDFVRALTLRPELTAARNSLAWLLATCPDARFRDGKKAFDHASYVFETDGGKNWDYVDTLAAAYAECGDMRQARDYANKAIDLATRDEDKETIRSRLAFYERGRPYREPAPR
jgi:tetratricopeptide (TPR) repeat protein